MDLKTVETGAVKTEGWFKAHQWVGWILAALLFFGGGFAAGHFSPNGTTTTKTDYKVVTVDKYLDRVVTNTVYVKVKDTTAKLNTRTVIVEVQKPDGTKEKTTTTDTALVKDTKQNDTTTQAKTDDKEHDATKAQETKTEVKVSKVPDWHVYAGVGVAIPTFLGQKQIGVPGLQGFVVQAGVERRIIGPFTAGIFGNTEGTVGITLGGNF